MKPKHTGTMPWDDIFDYKYYKISKARMRIFKIKLIKEKRRWDDG